MSISPTTNTSNQTVNVSLPGDVEEQEGTDLSLSRSSNPTETLENNNNNNTDTSNNDNNNNEEEETQMDGGAGEDPSSESEPATAAERERLEVSQLDEVYVGAIKEPIPTTTRSYDPYASPVLPCPIPIYQLEEEIDAQITPEQEAEELKTQFELMMMRREQEEFLEQQYQLQQQQQQLPSPCFSSSEYQQDAPPPSYQQHYHAGAKLKLVEDVHLYSAPPPPPLPPFVPPTTTPLTTLVEAYQPHYQSPNDDGQQVDLTAAHQVTHQVANQVSISTDSEQKEEDLNTPSETVLAPAPGDGGSVCLMSSSSTTTNTTIHSSSVYVPTVGPSSIATASMSWTSTPPGCTTGHAHSCDPTSGQIQGGGYSTLTSPVASQAPRRFPLHSDPGTAAPFQQQQQQLLMSSPQGVHAPLVFSDGPGGLRTVKPSTSVSTTSASWISPSAVPLSSSASSSSSPDSLSAVAPSSQYIPQYGEEIDNRCCYVPPSHYFDQPLSPLEARQLIVQRELECKVREIASSSSVAAQVQSASPSSTSPSSTTVVEKIHSPTTVNIISMLGELVRQTFILECQKRGEDPLKCSLASVVLNNVMKTVFPETFRSAKLAAQRVTRSSAKKTAAAAAAGLGEGKCGPKVMMPFSCAETIQLMEKLDCPRSKPGVHLTWEDLLRHSGFYLFHYTKDEINDQHEGGVVLLDFTEKRCSLRPKEVVRQYDLIQRRQLAREGLINLTRTIIETQPIFKEFRQTRHYEHGDAKMQKALLEAEKHCSKTLLKNFLVLFRQQARDVTLMRDSHLVKKDPQSFNRCIEDFVDSNLSSQTQKKEKNRKSRDSGKVPAAADPLPPPPAATVKKTAPTSVPSRSSARSFTSSIKGSSRPVHARMSAAPSTGGRVVNVAQKIGGGVDLTMLAKITSTQTTHAPTGSSSSAAADSTSPQLRGKPDDKFGKKKSGQKKR